jgi:hypothetical protein
MRALALGLAIGTGFLGTADAAPPRSAEVVAGAWLEEREESAALVVAAYRRAGTEGPATAFVGCSVGTDEDRPGGTGTIPADGWTEIPLEAGVLTRAERLLDPAERERPPSVLLASRRPEAPLPVHPLIVGETPEGSILFARPRGGGTLTVARHVLEVGETTEVTLEAPPPEFFLLETLEVAVVSRRLGIDGADPEGESGHVRLTWLPAEGEAVGAGDLAGAEGERRIRSRFTDPGCPWANRHVAWTTERWVIEYRERVPLRFRLETETVAHPGAVSPLWKGYGAVGVEAIYPNGFGGSSTNFDLPPVLVLPKGTPVRAVALRSPPPPRPGPR